MGFDFSLNVVLGVELTRVTKYREETKYNPDTGEPFQKSIPYEVHQIVGTDIEIPGYAEDDICSCDYESDYGRFYGVKIYEGEGGSADPLWFRVPADPGVLQRKRDEAATLLAAIGYDGPIDLYTYVAVSY